MGARALIVAAARPHRRVSGVARPLEGVFVAIERVFAPVERVLERAGQGCACDAYANTVWVGASSARCAPCVGHEAPPVTC